MARAIRILGIDPGLRRTGWGVIAVEGNRLVYVACGSVRSNDKAALGERLAALHDELVRVVDAFRPDEAAVEATFVNKDAAATLKLGQARGIALLVPAKAGVAIAEYAPNLIKKTIVGAGHGDKAQIRMMLGVLLPKAAPKSHDAADALAIAITHAHHRRSAVLASPLPACGERSPTPCLPARAGEVVRGRVRGPLRQSEPVETAPHPDPLPASGESEQRRRATCDSPDLQEGELRSGDPRSLLLRQNGRGRTP
jgi:crossover junction endodeoxyribonuclease RuvC